MSNEQTAVAMPVIDDAWPQITIAEMPDGKLRLKSNVNDSGSRVWLLSSAITLMARNELMPKAQPQQPVVQPASVEELKAADEALAAIDRRKR